MEFDLTKRYCYYFNEICKIPHGSKNEKQLSDWLVRFAAAHGLAYIQDDLFNVVIYRPASPGYENHPGVIIQAHMDMVCEKVPGSRHDFLTDPLELYVEGDHLRARGTTLGADDGMGCAYMLAILENRDLPAPYLECCFTTQEEVGLVGALHLKPAYFKARRLINLDGAHETRTYMSMGGGETVTVRKKIGFMPDHGPVYRLAVRGLLGGHSGGEIDKERANAIHLLARILCRMTLRDIPYRLIRMEGGSKGNVIPSAAEAWLSSPAAFDRLQAAVKSAGQDFLAEYEFSDAGIQLELTAQAGDSQTAMSENLSRQIAEMVYLLPTGLIAMSPVLKIPLTSLNLGVVSVQGDRLKIVESIRSALDSGIADLKNRIALIAGLYGAETETAGYYPGWRYDPHSPLREKMCQVFGKIYGKPLACLAGHGGNECGVFKKMHPDMDIVTSGAEYGRIHTTEEYLDLASFDRTYHFLTCFLSQL